MSASTIRLATSAVWIRPGSERRSSSPGVNNDPPIFDVIKVMLPSRSCLRFFSAQEGRLGGR